jgi:hypothetical protein
MHQNASHIYVGERTSVWCAQWGGGGGPCPTESDSRGSRRRAAEEACLEAVEEETGVEAVAEETGVERRRRRRRSPV